MAPSRLRPFIFFDLPLELRMKIYRKVFAGSEIKLTLTQKHSRTAITSWAPPKDVRFLRTSSQIYEESLPILASSSRLKLSLSTDGLPETEAANFRFNFQHLLASPATGLFLRSTLPLVQTMDLVLGKWLFNGQLEGLEGQLEGLEGQLEGLEGQLEGLEALTLLKEIHSGPTYLSSNHEASRMTGFYPRDIDEEFLRDPAWESKVLTTFRSCLDFEFLMLKNIIIATAGKIRICQSLQFLVGLPDSVTSLEIDVDVVESRIVRKRLMKIKTKLGKIDFESKFEFFDTSEAFLKYLHKAKDEVQSETSAETSSI